MNKQLELANALQQEIDRCNNALMCLNKPNLTITSGAKQYTATFFDNAATLSILSDVLEAVLSERIAVLESQLKEMFKDNTLSHPFTLHL